MGIHRTIAFHAAHEVRGFEGLPEWPAAAGEQPEVSADYEDGNIETVFTFPDGAHVTCYQTGSIYEPYTTNTLDEPLRPSDDLSPELDIDESVREDVIAWMEAVHDRIDGLAYGLAIAAFQQFRGDITDAAVGA
jgi:hypothetical protein